jgi:hypothetical protein
MPELDSKIAIERRQLAINYITEQGLPSKPIKRFLTKHFKHYAEDGTEYIPTLYVKDEFDKKGNRQKKGSKSSLTLKHFEEIFVNGSAMVEDKDGKKVSWKPWILDNEAEYYEIRPCFAKGKPMAIIDIDGIKSSGDVSLAELIDAGVIPEVVEDAAFFLSRTKSLPHFIFAIDGMPENIKVGQYVNVFKNFEGDLLLNHAWEKLDSQLYNYDGQITTVAWKDLVAFFDPEKVNAKKLIPKPEKPVKEKKEKAKKTDTETDGESSVDDEKVKKTIEMMEKIVMEIIRIEPDYFHYDTRLRMIFGFFNESCGTALEETARKKCKDLMENHCGGDNYTESEFNRVWYGAKPKQKEAVKITMFFKWLNEIDPQNPLLKEHINSRLSSGCLSAEEIRQSDEYLDYRIDNFEKTHFKLLNPVRYIEIDNDKRKGTSLIFRDPTDFKERLRDETGMPIFKVKGGICPIPTKFHELWLDDTDKRKHSKLVFDPSWKPTIDPDQTVPVYNAFGGFPNHAPEVKPMAEKESDFIALMRYLFQDDKVFEYMKCWVASIIQRPEFKTKVAPILYSRTHGTGKNTFVDGVVAVLGRINCGVVESIDDITRNFNAHLCNKLFIYGDEISANAKKVADKLKQVITRPEQNLEKKGVDAVLVDDFTNWLFTTNNENCFKAEEGCRRLLMVHCCEQKQTEYSAKSYAEIGNPEKLKQLFAFFKTYEQSEDSIKKYGKFNIGQDVVIETQYKKEMIFENRPAYIQLLYKAPETLVGKTLLSTALYEEAQRYAKAHFLSSNFTAQEFGKQSLRYLEAYKKHGNIGNKYTFPETKTELLKHLFSVDESYYRYIFQLEDNFVPEFKPPVKTKNEYGLYVWVEE